MGRSHHKSSAAAGEYHQSAPEAGEGGELSVTTSRRMYLDLLISVFSGYINTRVTVRHEWHRYLKRDNSPTCHCKRVDGHRVSEPRGERLQGSHLLIEQDSYLCKQKAAIYEKEGDSENATGKEQAIF
ncbi:hypothetical protein Tco_1303521 [Tanacetum coccineum]